MKSKAQQFLAGPMQIDLRQELHAIRQACVAARTQPDLIWRRLCSVAATSGSSMNAQAFMDRYETDLRFDLLPKTGLARTKAIRRVLEVAKVPRMRDQKAQDLSANYLIVKSLGGPEEATRIMLGLSGKMEKQAWIRQFKGVGRKYSNDVWMSIADPDFENSMAIDARVKSFSRSLGLDVKSDNLESQLCAFAASCNLSGWELDRLIFNFGSLILKTITNRVPGAV